VPNDDVVRALVERGGLGPSSDSDFIEDDQANAMKLRQRVKLLELELKRIRTHLANARTRRDQLYSGAGVEVEGEEGWGDGRQGLVDDDEPEVEGGGGGGEEEMTLNADDMEGLGSLENAAQWHAHKLRILKLEGEEKKAVRALEMARLYSEEYPSESVEVDETIPALTETEMKEARLLFPNMTVGIPENHSCPGYAGEFVNGWLYGRAPVPYPVRKSAH
jgi:hypothetical protein